MVGPVLLCYCSLLLWFRLLLFFSVFLLTCYCKKLTGKTRLQSDLRCVDVDVKPYSLALSLRYPTCISTAVGVLLFSWETVIKRSVVVADVLARNMLENAM